MSVHQIIVALLLVVAVAVELLCCVGVWAMGNVFDRLHYTAPATTIGPLAIAIAVVVQERFSQAGIKVLIVFGLLVVTNPVLTHATARAARIRQFGHWVALPAERVDEPL